MILYKYMPWEYWIDSVLKGRFKMGRPIEFNDPFECIYAVSGTLSEDYINTFVNENFVCSNELPTREKFKEVFKQEYRNYFKNVEAHRVRVNSLCLILSLVAKKGLTNDGDLLMWSHYANHARGVRITFDIPTTIETYALEHVKYSNHIPTYNLSSMTSYQDINLTTMYRSWICTKGMAWKYENEVRLIIHEPNIDVHRVIHNGVECFNMPHEWIKEVTFGSEVDNSIAIECKKYFDALDISPIHWKKAYKKKFEYGLEYCTLK
jgi:hypothetical protein